MEADIDAGPKTKETDVDIAIVGAGVIGRTISARFVAAGNRVTIGSRDPERVRLEAGGLEADVADIPTALSGAEVVVIAIPGNAVAGFLADHGERLDGKVVVDTANKIGSQLGDRFEMNSVAEIAAAAPDAKVYRAFNSLGWENFADPVIDGVQADLLYAGPDGESRAVMERLIADVGLRPVRVGDLDAVALVDTVAALWGALAMRQGLGRRLFFKVVTPTRE